MLLEIQRTVILFVLLLSYICAQEVAKVGGKIKVESLDPFAKPGVDPFASIRSAGGSGAQKQGATILTKKETVRTVTTNNKPVVDGSDVRSSQAGTSKNTQTTNEKPYVETTTIERKTRVIGSGSGTLRKSSNTNAQNIASKTETTKTQRTVNVVNRGTGNTGTQSRSGSVQTTGSRSQSSTTRTVQTTNTGSRTGSGERNTDLPRQTGGNRGSGQNTISVSSQTDRQLGQIGSRGSQNTIETVRRNDNVGPFGSSGGSNTGIYTNDGTMKIDTNRGNALPEMGGEMGATDKPILYFRKLYHDQSICLNCIGSGSDCYTEHPDDCRKYIRCTTSSLGGRMEALEMDCAFGTFWSNEANTCDTASEVFCNKDPCMDTSLKTYHSGLNCRSYWRCVNGRSNAECCDNGQEFVDGHCIPSDRCTIDDGECPFKSQFLDTIPEKKPTCNLEPVPEKGEKAFRMNNHWALMYCADGTKFDMKTCGCIVSIFNKVRCVPTVDIGFDEDRVIDRTRGYIKSENVTVTGGKGSAYALFQGESEINVPYFKNNENIKSHLVVSVRFFKNDDKGPGSQVLASNCKTSNKRTLTPSFAILLNKKEKQIVFFASTKKNDKYGATQHITLPFTPGKWTTATLKFLDETLQGTVETLEADGTPKIQKEEKPLKGTLNTGIMPLMIGTCNMNDGFFGYIHKAKAYMCKPDQP